MPKHGHTAVERNRLKRRLREITRLTVIQGIGKLAVVIRIRPAAYEVSVSTLRDQLHLLVAQLLKKVC